MNYLTVALFLVAAIVVIEAYPGFGTCETSDDCGDKRCCVRVGGHFFKMTRCKAERKEGKKCIPQGSQNGLYDFECPCEEGLECVGEEKVEPTKSDASSDSSSSSSEEDLEYRCRAVATSGPPEVSSQEPEPSGEPESEEPSDEPVVEEENVEIPEPIV